MVLALTIILRTAAVRFSRVYDVFTLFFMLVFWETPKPDSYVTPCTYYYCSWYFPVQIFSVIEFDRRPLSYFVGNPTPRVN